MNRKVTTKNGDSAYADNPEMLRAKIRKQRAAMAFMRLILENAYNYIARMESNLAGTTDTPLLKDIQTAISRGTLR